MFKSILGKEKIEVIPIKVIDDKPKEWNGNGITDTQAINLVSALYALEHPRFKEISFFIARHNEYLNVWTDVYQLLSKKKDEEIENFFVEYLVNTDIERNDIKKIIDVYLEKY